MGSSSEYKNFETVASEIMKVTHAEIKAKLDAEKLEKKKKKAAKAKNDNRN
jgi:hypothetical protein